MRSRLNRISPPDEAAARDRAWHVIEAAYAEREPAPPERRPLWPVVAIAAAALAVTGAALSPPGMAVVDSIRRAIGVEHAQPALFSLPAKGRLLVVEPRLGGAASNVWVVQPDGSKRNLGEYQDASWSPFGRFIVTASENELRTLEPSGKVHWTLARPFVRSPRWGGSRTDTRIAYVSKTDLRVVGGDGRGDRLLARQVRGVLAWRPGPGHQLSYASGGRLYLRNADSGTLVWTRRIRGIAPEELLWSSDGKQLVLATATGPLVLDSGGRTLRRIRGSGSRVALSPDAKLAYIRRRGGTSDVYLDGKRVFSGIGDFGGLAWSPDGRWLLVTWPTANQWVFVRVAGPRKIVANAAIARQFGGAFPRVAGWCC